jgi:hypothetical protein
LHIHCDLTTTVPSSSPFVNLHPVYIHSDDPLVEDAIDDAVDEKGDIASIPRANLVDDAIDVKGVTTTSTPRENPVDDAIDEKGTTTSINDNPALVTTLTSPDIDEKVDTTSIPPTDDENDDTTSTPRGIYPIVAVGGVVTVVLLGCFAIKKQKRKSTKKPLRGVIASSSQSDTDENSHASPVSVQESYDVKSKHTGRLKEVYLEDDDVERGNSILVSEISSSREWDEDTNTTPTEQGSLDTPDPSRSLFPVGTVTSILNMAGIAYLNKVYIKSIQNSPSEKAVAPSWQLFDGNDSSSLESHGTVSDYNTEDGNLGTPGLSRSVFPGGTVASILNIAGIAYLKRVDIKSIHKSPSEKAVAPPWQLFDRNDSSSLESHGSVSESNVDNDDMSSSTGSVYIEDAGINDSDSDGSSISSHQDWKDAQSMDNTFVWSFSAAHIDDTCEMVEI